MLKQWIGKQSVPTKNIIEYGAVQKFADAIGDMNLLYFDEEYAENSPYKGLIAPPTFEKTLNYKSIEGLPLPNKGLIYGEQKYIYKRPLKAGEQVWCYVKLADVYEKQGSGGTLKFLVMEKVGEDGQGERIYTAKSVLIITETVLKTCGNKSSGKR